MPSHPRAQVLKQLQGPAPALRGAPGPASSAEQRAAAGGIHLDSCETNHGERDWENQKDPQIRFERRGRDPFG